MKQFFNKITKIGTIFLVAGLWSFSAMAADYTSMSNAELAELRGTMRDATTEEVNAFRTEWQSRLQNMTVEERRSYSGRPENAPADGQGIRRGARNSSQGARLQAGGRQGSGQKAGLGQGSSRGAGSRMRGNR